MLVINYNGNKPISNYFKYGVVGNNNADVVRFVVLKNQGYADLSEATSVKVKCLDEFGEALEEVEIDSGSIEERENMLFVDWLISKDFTSHNKLQVCLSFIDENENVWQTQLFTLKLMNGVFSEEAN